MKSNRADRYQKLRDSLIDDKKRENIQYITIYVILTAVAAAMTVVNLFTDKFSLMLATCIFAVLNLANLFLTIKGGKKGVATASVIFVVEIFALFLFFIISGTPEGFSAIWICLLPTSGLLLFGRKRGTMISILMFLILLFFFETPWGVSTLQFDYTESFRLRFPMLYVAFYAVSFFLETVRAFTNDRLEEMQVKYKYLYCHDALTDLYNRYGFNEKMEALLSKEKRTQIALMIVDIDHFKNVNDRYGHEVGDLVLKKLAAFLLSELGDSAFVCRWGGEEFAILLEGDTDAAQKAKQIVETIAGETADIGGNEIAITVSIGLVTVDAACKITATELLIHADRCLYRAKDAGRNRVEHEDYTVPAR